MQSLGVDGWDDLERRKRARSGVGGIPPKVEARSAASHLLTAGESPKVTPVLDLIRNPKRG